MTRSLFALLVLYACKTDPGETDDPGETGETGDTEDTSVETVTLTWDLRPDPGLAAPAAAALKVGDTWEVVDAVGEQEVEGRYQLAVACIPPEGRADIVVVDADVTRLPAVQLGCPWLDPEQRVAVSVSLSEVSGGQDARVQVGAESVSTIADAPPVEITPVAGATDVALSLTATLSTGRSTMSLALQREQEIAAGDLVVSGAGAMPTTQEERTAPPFVFNGEPISMGHEVSLWTAGGTAAELGTGSTDTFSWGMPPAEQVASGDRLLGVSTGGQSRVVAVSAPGGELSYDGVDGEATVTLSGNQISWTAVCYPTYWFHPERLSSETATWTILHQAETATTESGTSEVPDAADVPGFEAGWSWGELTSFEGGLLVIDGDPTAGLLLWRIGAGSGLVGPSELIGDEALSVAQLMGDGVVE